MRKSLSRVLLFCLLLIPVFVEASRKQKREQRSQRATWLSEERQVKVRRVTPCDRVWRLLGIPLAVAVTFSTGVQAIVSISRALYPRVVCNVGEKQVTFFSPEQACRQNTLFHNGMFVEGSLEGECWLLSGASTIKLAGGPRENLPRLAKTAREKLLKNGDRESADACLLYEENGY